MKTWLKLLLPFVIGLALFIEGYQLWKYPERFNGLFASRDGNKGIGIMLMLVGLMGITVGVGGAIEYLQ